MLHKSVGICSVCNFVSHKKAKERKDQSEYLELIRHRVP